MIFTTEMSWLVGMGKVLGALCEFNIFISIVVVLERGRFDRVT